ncbi:MAG: YggU family protein, partial [Gammaproteobacteria bacterium]|nr:YggU family protein [Gammaproteobacteria bacterium]
IHGDRLKVRLQAPPVEGRANARLVRFLAEVFGVPRGRVELLAGAGGREKRVRVRRPTALPPPVRRAPG